MTVEERARMIALGRPDACQACGDWLDGWEVDAGYVVHLRCNVCECCGAQLPEEIAFNPGPDEVLCDECFSFS